MASSGMAKRSKKPSPGSGVGKEPQSASAPPRELVELGAAGRLVIPVSFRNALGIKPGDRLNVELHDNELRVYSYREGIRRAQELIRKYIPEGVSLVDELIADRRREAAEELKDHTDE
jgi:AbrB family looped-hinge helix DNA binding protein